MIRFEPKDRRKGINLGDGKVGDSGRDINCRAFSGVAIAILLVFFSVLSSEAMAQNYRGPFEGRVVDAETMEPIEGAVVLVRWVKRHMMSRETFYDAIEVRTGTNGEFFVPKKWSWNPWTNLVMDSSIIIFKAGYGHVGTHFTDLEGKSEFLRSLSSDKRKEVGPQIYYNINFDNNIPIFVLKRLKSIRERFLNLSRIDPGSGQEYKPILLTQEIQIENIKIQQDKERLP